MATGTGSRSAVGFLLQPSEFCKLALILWGADVLTRKRKGLCQSKHMLVPVVPLTVLISGSSCWARHGEGHDPRRILNGLLCYAGRRRACS